MANYFADNVAGLLAAALAGTPEIAEVFVGRIPDTPDDCVAVIERPGIEPLVTMTGQGTAAAAPEEEKSDRPRLQIRVRAVKYVTARSLAHVVFRTLHGLAETTVGDTPVHLILAVQSPHHLGLDEKQRHEFSQNFDCRIEDLHR